MKTPIHTDISELVQAKVVPVVAERIMADVALQHAKTLLTRTNAELMRVKHANHRLRVRAAVLAILLATSTGLALAGLSWAEGNHNGNGGGGGDNGGSYHNGADRPQPYNYQGFLSPYGGISEPGCHVCSGGGGQYGYASQASLNGF